MGLNLKDLVVREKTTLEAFSNKVIAIDAYNAIYQFLASIRGPDGLQLTDVEEGSQVILVDYFTGMLIFYL